MKKTKMRFRYYIYDSDPTPDGKKRAAFAVINPLVDFLLFRFQYGGGGFIVVLLNLEFSLRRKTSVGGQK